MSKNWISGAIEPPGALHKELGIPEGHPIPVHKLEEAARKGGKLGKRVRLALTLRKTREKGPSESK